MSERFNKRIIRPLCYLVILLGINGCEPSERRPGLWLHGDVAASTPNDWAFTDDFKEVFVEVKTPYFLPHSVTIWCAQVDGDLYIGAREAHTKNWPGWMEKTPNIRLKIGDELYEVAAQDLVNDAEGERVRAAYTEKYKLPPPTDATPEVRYWKVVSRSLYNFSLVAENR